jgi:hypothetical protein
MIPSFYEGVENGNLILFVSRIIKLTGTMKKMDD